MSDFVRFSRSIGIAIGFSAFILGCGDDGSNPTDPGNGGDDLGLRDLAFEMTGMDPHVGQLVEIRIVGDDTAKNAHGSAKNAHGNELESKVVLDPLPAADFRVNLPDGVPSGAHNLDFYADLNGNRAYDAPPADHAWRIALGASGALAPTFAHNTTFTDIENPAPDVALDFTMNVTGVSPHVGQLFEVRVIDTETGHTVGQYRLASIASADFTITIPGVVHDGTEYSVDYYADLNGNGEYDAPTADHAWRDIATAGASGLTIDFAHNTNFTDIQFTDSGGELGVEQVNFRDLAFTMTAMGPHIGQMIGIRIVAGENEKTAHGDGLESHIILDPLPSDGFELFVPKGVADGEHTLDFFADLNMNGVYDPPTADHAWRIDLAAAGDLEPAFEHNTNFTDIENPAPAQGGDFTMNVTGLSPHVGQLFEVRVIDNETDQTVGQYRLASVASADFTLVIPGIIKQGTEYTVDYYADLNQNGEYDAPTADHAWRDIATGGPSGLTIDFAHNTNFTDIDFVDSGGEIAPPAPTFSQIQSEILTPNCLNAGCHPGGGAPMSLAAGSAYNNLVNAASSYGIDRVEPGDAQNSALWLKVIGDQSTGNRMPLFMTPLTQDQTDMIRDWIDAGALDN